MRFETGHNARSDEDGIERHGVPPMGDGPSSQ